MQKRQHETWFDYEARKRTAERQETFCGGAFLFGFLLLVICLVFFK